MREVGVEEARNAPNDTPDDINPESSKRKSLQKCNAIAAANNKPLSPYHSICSILKETETKYLDDWEDFDSQLYLPVNLISKVQMLRKDNVRRFEQKGVLFFELQNRFDLSIKPYRVIVLRQSLAQTGQVVLMRLSNGEAKAITTRRLDLQSDGGIHKTH